MWRLIQRASRLGWAPGIVFLLLSGEVSAGQPVGPPAPGAPGPPSSTGAPPAVEPNPADAARALFERGRARYEGGEFDAAALDFEEGYRLQPEPLFLYNAAQAYRKAGRIVQALALYRQFLAVDPGAPERGEVERYITELEREHPATAEPPAPAPHPRPTPGPQRRGDLTPGPSQPHERRSHTGWWIAGGVAVGAVLTGLTLFLVARPDGPPDTDLGNHRIFP